MKDKVMPHEDHFAGCGCEVVDGKSLPPGVKPADNMFDFFEIYKLNGPPNHIGIYVNEGKDTVEASDVVVESLMQMIGDGASAEDYERVPPFMELILVVEWENGQSYHIRFTEVMASALYASLKQFFEGRGLYGLALYEYGRTMMDLLYNRHTEKI
ncbi:MAG TPA: hypothetical protein VGD26_10440 [Chitinophagaceae bacterium]